MDRLELIHGFIRENLDTLMGTPFNAPVYRSRKRQYFLERHGNSQQGNPRDSEIASETVWFLIKRGQVRTKEDLDKVLATGLMKEKCPTRETFYLSLEASKSAESVVDFAKLHRGDFLESVREQIREELQKEMEIQGTLDEQVIKQRLAEYAALPSVIDAQEYEEPAKPPEEFETEENLEWWQRLHLTGDPFPATEGLFKVKPESYESVVVKTPIFQKYIGYMETAPDELFKNAIFFGEFGSGKTTLFQYLRKALEAHRIYSVYVHLFAEKDFQSLKIVFKEKLVKELMGLLGEEEGAAAEHAYPDVDAALIGLMSRLNQKLKPKGLVVFVDDLNKRREDYGLALEFLNYLQVFTYELADKTPLENLAFYVAGALEWEPIVRSQPKFTGSLARRVVIPDITEDQAWTMLNKRLEAYYPNPELKREVGREFVSQVYRDLKANKLELTFRNFIQRLVAEFRQNNFRVLVSDPVHIPQDTLQKIKATFDADRILKERFRTLFEEKIQLNPENRIVCVRLLLDIFLKEKTKRLRDEDLEVDKRYYLKQLAVTGLISKVPEGKGDHSWAVCMELRGINKRISTEFSLSLEDYLLKIYGIAPARRRGANEELQQIQSLSEKCEKDASELLNKVHKLHTEIIEALENYSLRTSELELLDKCEESLDTLTQFFVTYVERPEESAVKRVDLTFWKDFWYFPDDVAQFQNLLHDEAECVRRIWYVLGIYRGAFNVLFSFVRNEHQGLSSVHISSDGLDNQDAKQLVSARDLWATGSNERCAVLLYNHMEGKMRTFVQNVLTLVYGDFPNRIRHLDSRSREKIQTAISMRSARPGAKFQETSSLALEDLVDLMTDNREAGNSGCWRSIFSKLLKPATIGDITAYCDKLVQLRDQYRDESETTMEESLDLREVILSTVELTRRMNAAYLILLKSVYLEAEGSGTNLYLSLDGLSDKSELIGLPFQASTTKALVSGMSSGQIPLDDQEYVQEYYSLPYRVVYINLAIVIDEGKAGQLGVPSGYAMSGTKGPSIYVKRIFRFSKENPPRISLAHSGKDSMFVQALAADLRNNQVRVYTDDIELREGNPMAPANHEPLRENDHLGIVLSQNTVNSEWVREDLSPALMKDLESKKISTHPLLYKECPVPAAIADKKIVNFMVSYERGLEELLSRIEQAAPKPGRERATAPIEERVANREDTKVERKSSLKFDVRRFKATGERTAAKAVEKEIAKTVAAFMNAEGGELFIGVDDGGNILGLSDDFSLMEKKSSDAFQIELNQSLDKYLQNNIIWELIDSKFELVQGKEICSVLVSPSPRPIFLHDEGRQECYVRVGNMSRPYTPEEFLDYSKRRFSL